jgi:hypothetical protein
MQREVICDAEYCHRGFIGFTRCEKCQGSGKILINELEPRIISTASMLFWILISAALFVAGSIYIYTIFRVR